MSSSITDAIKKEFGMSEREQKVRYGVGSAAAGAAIFAPLDYKWKGLLTLIAAEMILTGIYEYSPMQQMFKR